LPACRTAAQAGGCKSLLPILPFFNIRFCGFSIYLTKVD
jgi:hypothetical protein